MRTRETNPISIAAAFAIGGLIGAGVALLMAPHSGYDTRQMLLEKGSVIKDKAINRVEDTRGKAKDTIDELKDKTRETASSMKSRVR